jgi:hypothetical protein
MGVKKNFLQKYNNFDTIFKKIKLILGKILTASFLTKNN